MNTICCSEVQKTATQAHKNPLTLISTSVTVQIPTPNATTMTAAITLLEQRLLFRIHSIKQTTGIILNFEICIQFLHIYQLLDGKACPGAVYTGSTNINQFQIKWQTWQNPTELSIRLRFMLVIDALATMENHSSSHKGTCFDTEQPVALDIQPTNAVTAK